MNEPLRRRGDGLNTTLRTVAALVVATLALGVEGRGSDLVEFGPLTDRIVLLHLDDGHVEHHNRGTPRSDERVVVDPLDTIAAMRPDSYALVSADDPAYRSPVAPRGVGRKTKGTEFAWFADRWEGGRAVNDRPDHAAEHWIYLALPSPMVAGKSYTV